MGEKYIELRRKLSVNFSDEVLYTKASWNHLDHKPSSFTPAPHSHPYLGENEKAVDSDKLDGLDSTEFGRQSKTNEWHHTLSGAYGTEKGYLDTMFVNKFDYFPLSNIEVEKSDDGVNWLPTNEYSDSQLKRMVGGDSTANIAIPNKGTNGSGYKRFTFTQPGYRFINTLYLYTTHVTGTLQVKVEKHHFGNDTWYTVKDWSDLGGWPGHHILRHDNIAFNDASTQYDKVRLTFYGETTNPSYINHTFYRMQWWGSYPAGRRTAYWSDEDKNFYYPGDIYAQSNKKLLHSGNDILIEKTDPKVVLRQDDSSQIDGQLIGSYETYSEDGDGHHTASFIRTIAKGTYGRQAALLFGVTVENAQNAVEAMRINEDGNLGINQLNPTEKLDVVGNVKISGNYFSGEHKIYHEGFKPSKADVGLSNADNTADNNKYVRGLIEQRASENKKIWVGTKSDYDAMGSGRPTDTIYLCKVG